MGGEGGLTCNHFDFTSISLWHPLKPPQITVKTEGPSRTAPGDQRHQGNQRNPKIIRKTKDSLSRPLRNHAGSTMEAPSSRRTTFYLISKQSRAERLKGRAPDLFRFRFNLTLTSLKTLANHNENEGTETNGTGGSAAPREPAKPKYHSKNKGQPL